jgi:hypothetical protein
MEPVTIASTIAGWIFSEASKEVGKALGKGASDKVAQLIAAIREKFRAAGTEGLLTRAETQPTKRNIEIVEGELVTQMDEDKAFANQLRELVQQLKREGVIPNSAASTNVNQNSSIGNVSSGSNTTIGDINTYRTT